MVAERKMIFLAKIIFLLHFTHLISCFTSEPTRVGEENVEIDILPLGKIRGKVGKSFFTSRPIYHFLGINYAEPPSKERRFQPPEDFKPWRATNTVYNATKMRQNCPQVATEYYPPLKPDQLDEKEDIEDCLVVNVFTPTLNISKPGLPVMFYIHGGSFYAGSAYDFFPDFLLEEDIILVVVQYRLGVLGFLSLNTDEIPGNLGMLDIILALEWVQKNIKYFGGNPNFVTVAGQSAGAAAVSALLVSPLVTQGTFEVPWGKGLFHKAIIQSGSSLSTWAIDRDPVKSALSIAKALECKSLEISDVAKCFKEANVTNLIKAHAKYQSEDITKCGTSLVIQSAGSKKVLVEHPRKTYEKGQFLKVPIMGGTTRDEGTSFVAGFHFVKNLSRLNDSSYYHRNVTRDALQFCGYYQDNLEIMTDYIHNIYFKNNKYSSFDEMAAGLVDICGVFLLKGSTYENLRLLSFHVPTFAYSFNFYGNISKLRSSDVSWSKDYPLPGGVAHSDELGYLYPSFRSNYTTRELKMVKTMTKYWSNFVKTGVPKEDWPFFDKPFGPYLRISDKSRIRKNVFDEFTVTSSEGFIKNSAKQIPISIFLFILTTLITCKV